MVGNKNLGECAFGMLENKKKLMVSHPSGTETLSTVLQMVF
jgi:hypothetical protein